MSFGLTNAPAYFYVSDEQGFYEVFGQVCRGVHQWYIDLLKERRRAWRASSFDFAEASRS
jgi:hypothetical protein